MVLSCFRYNEGEIHFNLMAMITDRKLVYQKQLDALTSRLAVSHLFCLLDGIGNVRVEDEKERDLISTLCAMTSASPVHLNQS